MSLRQAIAEAFKDIREGFVLTPLWWRLGLDQTIARYRRTILGPFWLASSTLATGMGLSLVFGSLFGGDWRQNFAYILSGVVCFNMISIMVSEAAQTYITASGTMQTRSLPLSFHALLAGDKQLINFAHQLIGYWAVTLILGQFSIPYWEFLFSLGLVMTIGFFLSFPLGMLAVRYRDVNYFVGFILQALFMLTPVFWKRSQIPAKMQWIADYNPLAHMLEIMRQPLLGHPAPMPDLFAVLATLAATMILALVSLMAFRRRVVFWL